MQKFIIGAIVATIVASPMVAAPALAAPQERHVTTVRQGPRGQTIVTTRDTRGPQFRHWRRGERFDARQARNYQVINNWRGYRGHNLYAPPRGYHWVRSGNDAVLVAVAGGLVGAVLAGALN